MLKAGQSNSNGYQFSNVYWGHQAGIEEIDWSDDGSIIASYSAGRHTTFWSTKTGAIIPQSDYRIDPFAWFDRRRSVDLGSEHGQQVVYYSRDNKALAYAASDGTILVCNAQNVNHHRVFRGHTGRVRWIAWSKDSRTIASGADDSTVGIWHVETGRLSRILEGHAGPVVSVSWSHDGKLIASKSTDGTVRLWRTDIWQTAGVIRLQGSVGFLSGLAFHSRLPLLAVGDDHDTIIHTYQILPKMLFATADSSSWSQYTNAKIVLVGDSTVGKSGLGLVLSKQMFTATESTHGRHVSVFETAEVELSKGRREMREALLWDLAGQPGYRLVHQLHLKEVTVALVVFDGRSETDPFGGVRHWTRALRQAQNVPNASPLPMKKFLVAARVDRGGISVSKQRLESLITELGFDGYFETSAKEGWQIKELSTAIRGAVDWASLPKVNSNALFQGIKEFLMEEKEAGHLLSTKEDLYHSFMRTENAPAEGEELKQQFETCIGRVESRDLIRRLRFGNLVLLQPEILDAYASAIVDAAKDEPDGLGSISEDDARSARFRMSSDERLQNKEQERLLLIATIEDLLAHEIALREIADDGAQLVFPSQFLRENPELPNPEGKATIFALSGAVFNVYATLAVRLSHCGLFKKDQMWRNAATYVASAGGICGMFLRLIEEGHAEVILFFDVNVSEQTRHQFDEYIHAHLVKRSVAGSVSRRSIFQCPTCREAITDKQSTARRQRGHNTITCPICDTIISLIDDRQATAESSDTIRRMDKSADEQREQAIAALVLDGKIATDDFDAFLAHNSKDKDQVEIVGRRLKSRGLYPWFDKEQVAPGTPFQDAIQQALPKVKSAVIFIGRQGIGQWQQMELRSLISQFVRKNIPVIPVLLPGVEEIPEELIFLKEMNYVSFAKGLDDGDAVDRLEWGITQMRPPRIVKDTT